jgi:two-component system, OmpR family, sensor histidine kinase KdpD
MAMAGQRGWGRRLWANEYFRAIGAVTVTVLVALPFRPLVQAIDIAILFLLTVVAVASTSARGPALVAVAASTAAFDFYFVPPYGTFAVLDRSYLFTFGVMFVVALVISRLTGRIREQAIEARRGEVRASALYEMVRDLAEAPAGAAQQLARAASHFGRVVEGEAEIVPIGAREANGDPVWPHGILDDVELRLTANWVARHARSAGRDTQTATGAEHLVIPIPCAGGLYGVAVVRPEAPERPIPDHEIRTLELLAQQAGRIFTREATPIAR